jgi:hypothetical protein
MAKKAKKAAKNGKAKKSKAASPEELKALEEQAKKDAESLVPVEIDQVSRDIRDIVADRVTVLPGSIGLKLSDQTTIGESLAILDYTKQMSDHVGFMIGDVLNFGKKQWGEKYNQAIIQTGRKYDTLKHYAWVASNIPPEKRQAALTFTHHEEILRIGDAEKVEEVLKDVGKKAADGEAPTTKEIRFKVQKLTPRKKKKSKRVTSGKSKKVKKVKELPPYQPTADEQSKLDEAEEALSAAAQSIKEGKIFQIVAKLDNKEKKRWAEMAMPIVNFYNSVDRVTGY